MTRDLTASLEEFDLSHLTPDEARQLDEVLEQLNEAALEMVGRLDRIHILAQDIVRDLRGARGLSSKENPGVAA